MGLSFYVPFSRNVFSPNWLSNLILQECYRLRAYFKIRHSYCLSAFNINHKGIFNFLDMVLAFRLLLAYLFSIIPPSLPVYVCFSSISHRSIIQGQQTGGNPPFARKVFFASNISCVSMRQIYHAYAKRTQKIALFTYAPLINIATGGKYPGNGRFFYRFLVNKSDFFVIFTPILPKNVSPITI